MSSAKNHTRRSRRGFAIQKSITGGMEAKTWIKTAEKKRQQEKVSAFRRIWRMLTGREMG